MRFRQRITCLAVAVGMLAAATGAPVRGQDAERGDALADRIPHNAALVVMIPDVSQFVRGVQAFGKNIVASGKTLDMDVREYLRERKLDGIVRPDGGLALVVKDLDQALQTPMRLESILLLPVVDNQKALDRFGAKKVPGSEKSLYQMDRATFDSAFGFDDNGDDDNGDDNDEPEAKGENGDQPETLYVSTTTDKLLAISEQRPLLKWYETRDGSLSKRLLAPQKRRLREASLFVYANLRSLQPAMKRGLREAEAFVLKSIEEDDNGDQGVKNGKPSLRDPDALSKPQSKEMARWLFAEFASVVDQLESYDLAVAIDARRLTVHDHLAFTEGGSIREVIARHKAADLFRGLPDRDFVLLTAADTEFFGALLGDFFKTFFDKLEEVGVNKEKLGRVRGELRTAFLELQAFNSLLDDTKQGWVAINHYFHRDPQRAYDRLMRELKKSKDKRFFGYQGLRHTGEKQVGGVQVDEYELSETEGDAIGDFWRRFFGPNVRLQSGVIKDAVVFAMSSQADPIRLDLCMRMAPPRADKNHPHTKELSRGDSALSNAPHIRAMMKDIPGQPVALIAVQPDGAKRLVSSMLNAIWGRGDGKEALPSRGAPNAAQAPLAVALTVEETGLGGYFVLPVEAVRGFGQNDGLGEAKKAEAKKPKNE